MLTRKLLCRTNYNRLFESIARELLIKNETMPGTGGKEQKAEDESKQVSKGKEIQDEKRRERESIRK
jgi:hypothetical protein